MTDDECLDAGLRDVRSATARLIEEAGGDSEQEAQAELDEAQILYKIATELADPLAVSRHRARFGLTA